LSNRTDVGAYEPFADAADQWLSQPLPQETAMSRKVILSFAAVAMLAGTALASTSADAMVLRRVGAGHPGHAVLVPIGHRHLHFHDHLSWWRWHRHYIVRPVGYVTPVVATTVQPGPCTCLTKNYTPEGMVVFQDLCTKEMASAPVAGTTDQSDAAQGPANYAGQTYQDYLKAHPDAAQPETKKN
jgi:hypothetical protein